MSQHDDQSQGSGPDGAGDPESDLVGTVLDGRYRIDRPLGRGGMGRVYVGTQLSVDRPVAIKVLRADAAADETLNERFRREARAMSEFTHPNIVRLIDFGREEDHGYPYLVMEKVGGVALGEPLEDGRMVPALALEVAGQVAAGLAEAHQKNIIHRDLKPENLHLLAAADGDLQVKVLDFGLAFPTEAEERLTEAGEFFGTPHYIAPEMVDGDDFDARVDLYALGALLFEMLTGEPPFTADKPFAVVKKHLTDQPPSVCEAAGGAPIPDSIESLVADLLAKDPRGRPASAADLRSRLRSIQRTLDVDPIVVEPDGSLLDSLGPWLAEEDDLRTRVESTLGEELPQRDRAGGGSDRRGEPESEASSRADATGDETAEPEESRSDDEAPRTAEPADSERSPEGERGFPFGPTVFVAAGALTLLVAVGVYAVLDSLASSNDVAAGAGGDKHETASGGGVGTESGGSGSEGPTGGAGSSPKPSAGAAADGPPSTDASGDTADRPGHRPSGRETPEGAAVAEGDGERIDRGESLDQPSSPGDSSDRSSPDAAVDSGAGPSGSDRDRAESAGSASGASGGGRSGQTRGSARSPSGEERDGTDEKPTRSREGEREEDPESSEGESSGRDDSAGGDDSSGESTDEIREGLEWMTND